MSQVLGLHGTPRINRQPASGVAVVEVRAVAESVVRRGRGGRLHVAEVRYRLEGRLRFDALARGPHLGLLSDTAGEWTLEARTAAPGETGDPLSIPVRTVSPVACVAASGRRNAATGEPADEATVEWRSLLTYTADEIGLSKVTA